MGLRGLSDAVILNRFPKRLTAVLFQMDKVEQVVRSRILTKNTSGVFISPKISGMQFICIERSVSILRFHVRTCCYVVSQLIQSLLLLWQHIKFYF